MRLVHAGLFTAVLSFLFVASPAQAALQLCNQTSYVLYAATGTQKNAEVATKGWLRVVPGACEIALSEALTADAYYLYARTSQAHAGSPRAWAGQTSLCAKDPNFSLRNPLGSRFCPSDDSFPLAFSRVDNNHLSAWTVTLTEQASITSLNAARQAGISRLLSDIGYRFKNPKVRDGALANFRSRAKLPADASADNLIDALETEAMKAATPAGYSICNDTKEPLWGALGTHEGQAWIARGWWKIAPGGCAHAITQPLKTDMVYLRVERQKKQTVVGGEAKFCVTEIEFEISGREKCASRGLREAGFAATKTSGKPGFAAHVSAEGLILTGPRR